MVGHRSLLLIACLLSSSWSMAATLTATVDRKEVMHDEYVVLTLSLVNSDTRLRAQGISPNVDLTLLTDDFELGVPREEHRFNISRNHGRSTSEITVELFPKRAGDFIIPAFTVDGVSSEPIHLRVHKGSAETNPEIFARSGVTNDSAWQREQIIAYLDLYHRIELKSAKLGGNIDTEPLQLELHKLEQTQREERVGGVTYNVVRTAWAITPLLSRDYTLYLPDIWIETGDGRRIRLPFEKQHIKVRALPDDVPPLAMVGRPILNQTSFSEPLQVNHATPWTITIRAPVSPAAFPEELPALDMPDTIKMYSDATQRTIDQSSAPVMGIATYRNYIIPLSAGDFSLPAIRIPYFDPDRGAMDIATLDSRKFSVKPPPRTTDNATTISGLPVSARSVPEKPEAHPAITIWQVISMTAVTLWLVTLGLWWHTQKRKSDASPTKHTSRTVHTDQHPLKTSLLDAFGSRTLEEGLNKWEIRNGPDGDVRHAVRAVQALLYSRDKPKNDDEIHDLVRNAVKKIKAVSTETRMQDPWSPRAFTPSLGFIEEKR